MGGGTVQSSFECVASGPSGCRCERSSWCAAHKAICSESVELAHVVLLYHATTCHHYCHHYCGRLAAQLHGGRWPQLCPVRAHLCFVLLHRGFGSAPGKPSAPWEATTSFANLCLNELGYLVGWLDELVNCLHNLHTENKTTRFSTSHCQWRRMVLPGRCKFQWMGWM